MFCIDNAPGGWKKVERKNKRAGETGGKGKGNKSRKRRETERDRRKRGGGFDCFRQKESRSVQSRSSIAKRIEQKDYAKQYCIFVRFSPKSAKDLMSLNQCSVTVRGRLGGGGEEGDKKRIRRLFWCDVINQ